MAIFFNGNYQTSTSIHGNVVHKKYSDAQNVFLRKLPSGTVLFAADHIDGDFRENILNKDNGLYELSAKLSEIRHGVVINFGDYYYSDDYTRGFSSSALTTKSLQVPIGEVVTYASFRYSSGEIANFGMKIIENSDKKICVGRSGSYSNRGTWIFDTDSSYFVTVKTICTY